jgi:hypothetical protein
MNARGMSCGYRAKVEHYSLITLKLLEDLPFHHTQMCLRLQFIVALSSSSLM